MILNLLHLSPLSPLHKLVVYIYTLLFVYLFFWDAMLLCFVALNSSSQDPKPKPLLTGWSITSTCWGAL